MRRLIIVLAAGSLALAGCGGGGGSKSSSQPLTKAEYQAKLGQIAKHVGAQLQKSASKSKTPSKQDLAEAKKAVGVFVGELEQVNPPAEIAQAHKDLIAAMRRLGNDVEGIFKKVAAAKTPSEGITALFGAPAIQALLKAQQEFKAKGYDLNLNG